MKERINYLDTIKGISIASVVLLHALMNNNNLYHVDHPILLNWVHLHCTSAFFFVNGFLYKESGVETPFKTLIKKFKSYYIPFVTYNLFFVLFHNVLLRLHLFNDAGGMYSAKDLVIALVKLLFGKMQPLTGPLWFLRALLLISVIYLFTDSLSSRILGGKYRYLINGIVSALLWGLSNFFILPTTFNINEAFAAFYIYYLGVLYHRFDFNRFIEKHLGIICSLCFIVSVIIANNLYVGINSHINPLWGLVATLTADLFIITLAQIKPFSDIRFIRFVGQGSMEIMALHFLAFKPISVLIVYIYGLSTDFIADIPIIKSTVANTFWQFIYLITSLALTILFYYIKVKIKKAYNKK